MRAAPAIATLLDMPSPPIPSDDLELELIALRGDVVRLKQTADRFAAMASEAAEAASRIAEQIRSLEDLAGVKPSQRFSFADGRLRGKEIGRVAMKVLKRRASDEPLHYRDWYQLVVDAGHRINGRDPVATFLTHVSRLPDVERVADQKGVYRLAGEGITLRATLDDSSLHAPESAQPSAV